MPRPTPSLRLPANPLLRAVIALAFLACLFVAPGHVLAHAELVSADPLPNASLVDAPERIEVTFSEPIDGGNATIELLDAQLRVLDGAGPVTVSDDATAASIEPITNVVEMMRSVGMPISDAVSKLNETARMARPNFVP